MMQKLMKRLADAERQRTPLETRRKSARTGRTSAMIEIRRRAQEGFRRAAAAAPSASDDAFSVGRAGDGVEGAPSSRKRAWETRGAGVDWMLERDAELAARHEALLRRKRPRRSLRASCVEREAVTRTEGLDS